MDALTTALLAAGEELGREHNWNFGEGDSDRPEPDDPFIEVVRKHLAPLMTGDWIEARRVGLNAELKFLEQLEGR